MICALEASIISTVKAEEKEEQRKIQFEKFKQTNINFCETVIADKILKASNEGRKSVDLVFCAESTNFAFNLKTCHMGLIKEKTTYANGKHSYTGDHKNPEVNLPMIMEYLKSHCYQLSTCNYPYKEWGWGERYGTELTIRW